MCPAALMLSSLNGNRSSFASLSLLIAPSAVYAPRRRSPTPRRIGLSVAALNQSSGHTIFTIPHIRCSYSTMSDNTSECTRKTRGLRHRYRRCATPSLFHIRRSDHIPPHCSHKGAKTSFSRIDLPIPIPSHLTTLPSQVRHTNLSTTTFRNATGTTIRLTHSHTISNYLLMQLSTTLNFGRLAAFIHMCIMVPLFIAVHPFIYSILSHDLHFVLIG